jgi:hypothetical protein
MASKLIKPPSLMPGEKPGEPPWMAGKSTKPAMMTGYKPEPEASPGPSSGGGGGAGYSAATSGLAGIDPMANLNLGGDISGTIKGFLQRAMAGKESPYSPEVVSGLKSEAKSLAEGQYKGGTEALDWELARSGMFKSPASLRARMGLRRQAGSDYSKAVTQIMRDKAMADYKAKTDALDRAQRWLDNYRSYAAQLTGMSINKEQAMAQIALGYANIDTQRASLAEQARQFDLGYGLQKESFEFTKSQNTVPIQLPDGTTKYIPASQLQTLGF